MAGGGAAALVGGCSVGGEGFSIIANFISSLSPSSFIARMMAS